MTETLEEAREWVEQCKGKYPEEDWSLLEAAFDDLILERDPVTGETIAPTWRERERDGDGYTVRGYHGLSVEGEPGDEGDVEALLVMLGGHPPWAIQQSTAAMLQMKVWRVRFERAFDVIIPERRELLEARYLRGLSYAEIGRRLGIRYQSVQDRVETALQDLRAVFARRGEELYAVAAGEL